MKFPDFQCDDKLQTFRNVLHDLDLIKNDFFEGDCNELVRIEKLQVCYIKELENESEIKENNSSDILKISRAREKFKAREYEKTLKIYESVINKNLLTDFDLRTIDYCKPKVS